MLWPAVRVARALWRGVEETAVCNRESSGRLRPEVLFPLPLTLVNRRASFQREPLFVYHTNKYRKASEPTCHQGDRADRIHRQHPYAYGYALMSAPPRTKTRNGEKRAVMGGSCYGRCVVFRNEAVATPWEAYGGVKPDLDPGCRLRADQQRHATSDA